jgi:hypothetical protein
MKNTIVSSLSFFLSTLLFSSVRFIVGRSICIFCTVCILSQSASATIVGVNQIGALLSWPTFNDFVNGTSTTLHGAQALYADDISFFFMPPQDPHVVPEPSSLMLSLLGVMGLGFTRILFTRKKKQS